MKAFRWILTATLLSTPVSAFADDWIFYSESTNGMISLYDRDSLKRTGSQVLVWVMRDHSKDKSVTYRTSKVRFKIDCVNETTTTLAAIFYKPNNDVEKSITWQDYQQTADPIAPGTVAVSLMDAVCG